MKSEVVSIFFAPVLDLHIAIGLLTSEMLDL